MFAEGAVIFHGRIYVAGGNDATGAPIAKVYSARINADGTLDTTFNTGAGVDGAVSAITMQPDGKVLIGGEFTTYNGTGRNFISILLIWNLVDTCGSHCDRRLGTVRDRRKVDV